jgi:nucleoside phosphorylase
MRGYIAMTGICAGVRKKVDIGDIVIVQSVFDYGSGKIQGGKLHPDYIPVLVDPELCSMLKDFATNGSQLSKIATNFKQNGGKPKSELKAHVGALASGAAVVADATIVADITEHKRSLLGIDMESYGVAKATLEVGEGKTKFIIVKAASDYADSKKGDKYQDYCAYVSAAFLKCFFEHHGERCFHVS